MPLIHSAQGREATRRLVCAMGKVMRAIYIHMLPHSSHSPDTSYMVGTHRIHTYCPTSSLVIRAKITILFFPIRWKTQGVCVIYPGSHTVSGRAEVQPLAAGFCLLLKQRHLFTYVCMCYTVSANVGEYRMGRYWYPIDVCSYTDVFS